MCIYVAGQLEPLSVQPFQTMAGHNLNTTMYLFQVMYRKQQLSLQILSLRGGAVVDYSIANKQWSATAELPVSYKLGPRWDDVITWPGFKSETSFGFPSPNYMGQCTWFFVNLKTVSFDQFSRFLFFVSVSYLASFFWAQNWCFVNRKRITSVLLVRWILL